MNACLGHLERIPARTVFGKIPPARTVQFRNPAKKGFPQGVWENSGVFHSFSTGFPLFNRPKKRGVARVFGSYQLFHSRITTTTTTNVSFFPLVVWWTRHAREREEETKDAPDRRPERLASSRPFQTPFSGRIAPLCKQTKNARGSAGQFSLFLPVDKNECL